MPFDRLQTGLGAKIGRRRSILILIGAFWFFAFVMLSIRGVFTAPWPLAAVAPRRLATAAFGTGLCLIMARFLDELNELSFSKRIACGLSGAVAMAILLTIFNMIVNRVIAPLPTIAEITTPEVVRWVMLWFGYTLAWTGTHLALIYHWKADDQVRRTYAVQGTAQKAKVAALQYQLNPHLLFNSLNSVSALVLEGRNEQAEAMLLNLTTFLRATLDADPGGTVALHEEIAFQQLYLAIEKVRFPERMQVTIDIPADLSSSEVPALILQPLVENAIRYAVEPSDGLTTIRLAANRDGGDLRLVVENDNACPDALSRGMGIGIKNVRERLHAHFGARAILIAGQIPEGGYRAEIRMPLSIAA